MRVLVAALVVAFHGAAFGAPRLAIYPLKAMGTSAEAMQQLEAALRIELKRAQDLEIVEGPAAGKAKDCRDAACLVAYGRSLDAAEVLAGEVRAMPDAYSVTMRLFDVASGKEVAHTAGSYNRDLEEMVWATRAQVAKLKAPQRYAGQLVVEAAAGSSAAINGSPVKLGEKLVMKAGLHEVRIERAGQATQSWVEVRFEHLSRARLAEEPGKIAVAFEPWAAPEKVEYARIAPPKNPPALEEPLAPLIPLEAPRPVPGPPEGEPKSSAVASGAMPLWPGIVAIVAGVALAGGGAYELTRVGPLRNELTAMGTPHGVPASQQDAARAKSNELNLTKTLGAAFVATGSVLAVGGTAYLIFAPAPGGAQVGVSGTF